MLCIYACEVHVNVDISAFSYTPKWVTLVCFVLVKLESPFSTARHQISQYYLLSFSCSYERRFTENLLFGQMI